MGWEYRMHGKVRRRYTGYTQKNGAVSKVNKKFISLLTRAQRTPSAAVTVQVSHALPEINFLLTFETAPFFCVYPVVRVS